MGEFHRFLSQHHKQVLETHCDNVFFRLMKATETHTFYSPDGERLTSFSISPADCPSW
jgi:hypothetical protein